jgi:diguanylate cyclase (GGDEF)-like protein
LTEIEQKSISKKVETYLNKQSKRTIFLVAVLIVLLVSSFDLIPHEEHLFSIVIFYTIPILVVSWFIGRGAGIFFSVVCSSIWLYSDYILQVTKGNEFFLPLYFNMVMRLAFFLWISTMLYDLKKALELQFIQSRTDYLTGLANRRYFVELAEREIARSRRYHHPFAFMYLDIDDFKKINDTQGHHGGDKLLATIGHTLKSSVRGTDVPVRLGGDEFAVLFTETTNEYLDKILNRVKTNLLNNTERSGQKVTFSIGCVAFKRTPDSIDEMIQRADKLAYDVKTSGKNNYKIESVS